MEKIDKAIVLTGMTCCGKSTLANMIATQTEYKKVSFGGYLFNYAELMGLDTKKETLQIIGQQFIDEDPKKFLSAVINFSVPGKLVIFEGVRHLSIFEEIKNISQQTISFFIDVRFDERLRRFNLREKEKLSENDFLLLDNHRVEGEIPKLKTLADVVLDGTADPKELLSSVLEKLEK